MCLDSDQRKLTSPYINFSFPHFEILVEHLSLRAIVEKIIFKLYLLA